MVGQVHGQVRVHARHLLQTIQCQSLMVIVSISKVRLAPESQHRTRMISDD